MYNVDKLQSLLGSLPANSLDLVLNKGLAAKFSSCGISVLDSWQDILPMVARYLGQPRLSVEPSQLDAVMKKLQEIRPYLRRIATSGFYEQLADGDLCLAIGYSGDAMFARRMAKEGDTKVRIEFAFPEGAVPLWVDSMVIPADSPNVPGALRFINFVMRPEISAEVTRAIGFPSGNRAAVQLLDPAVRDNVAIYPPAQVRALRNRARLFGGGTPYLHPCLAAILVRRVSAIYSRSPEFAVNRSASRCSALRRSCTSAAVTAAAWLPQLLRM
jgi:putrescine transport system substrate-binding protein